MKILIPMLALACVAFSGCASPPSHRELITSETPRSKILGQAINEYNEEVIIREVIVPLATAEEAGFDGLHCYRFEFYSMGFLQSCVTRWDFKSAAAVHWLSDTKCHVVMLDGWLTADFDSDRLKYGGWEFERRID